MQGGFAEIFSKSTPEVVADKIDPSTTDAADQGGDYDVADSAQTQHCDATVASSDVSKGLDAAMICMTDGVEAVLGSSGISVFEQEVATSMVGLKIGQVFKDTKPAVKRARHSGKLPGWGKIFEICTSDDSMLGKVAHRFQ